MNQKSTSPSWWRRFAAIAFLMGYLLAFVINELHPILSHEHHNSHEHCSDEKEKDPCHRLVFHNDINISCEHDGHFHEPKHECDLCDVLLAQFDFPKIKSFDFKIFKSETCDFSFEEKIFLRFSNHSIFLRGPPLA